VTGVKATAQTRPAVARRDIRRSAGAFTILEVMVSAFVMVLVLTSSLTVLQRGYQAIDSARYQTLAGQILQSQMEKLRLLSWNQLTGTSGPGAPGGIPANGSSVTSSFTPDLANTSNQVKNFQCTQTLNYDPAAIYNDSTQTYYHTMVDITLTATWTGVDGMQRSRIYKTQYAQNGISDICYTP
jgi:type II secretory pathway pseudopilin PulG